MLLLLTAAVVGFGRLLLRAIGKSSPVRRRHGQFVLAWMLGGWIVGVGFTSWEIFYTNDRVGKDEVVLPAFGLLVGWAIGMIHGAIAIAIAIAVKPEKPSKE